MEYNSPMSVNTDKHHPDRRLEETCLRRITGWKSPVMSISEESSAELKQEEKWARNELLHKGSAFQASASTTVSPWQVSTFLTHLHLSKSRGHEYNVQLSWTQNHQALVFLLRFCNASFTVI